MSDLKEFFYTLTVQQIVADSFHLFFALKDFIILFTNESNIQWLYVL